MTGIEPKYIKCLMENGFYTLERMGKKTAVMVYTLESGFEITVSSACCNPEDFDFNVAREICLKKVEDKLWELEGYVNHVETAKRKESRGGLAQDEMKKSAASRPFNPLEPVPARLRLKKHSAGWIEAYAAIYQSPTARIRIRGWVPGVMVMAGQGCERGMMIIIDARSRENRWIPSGYEVESRHWEIWDEENK